MKVPVSGIIIVLLFVTAEAQKFDSAATSNLTTLNTRIESYDPVTAYTLANQYMSGAGVAQDYVRAAQLFRIAPSRAT